MDNLLLQFLGLVFLLAGLAIGYRLWVRPHAAALGRAGYALLALLIVTLMGGGIGAGPWWFDTPWSFAWDLPPLAGRLLGAAGLSFVVANALALQRPTRARVRLALLLLATYLLPLALAIVLFHRDRFDPAAPITYGFFAIVLPLVAGSLYFLGRQPAIVAETPEDRAPASAPSRRWLLALALATGVLGIALFLTDQGPLSWIWVWPGDLLSSRLIGVMLLAIALGALYALRWRATARMMLAMALTYGLGAIPFK